MIKPGLYLNNMNGQTFEVEEHGWLGSHYFNVYYPDFFGFATCVSDELTDTELQKLVDMDQIMFIGAV